MLEGVRVVDQGRLMNLALWSTIMVVQVRELRICINSSVHPT